MWDCDTSPWTECLASAGNRTRVTSMATMYSATRPLMLLMNPMLSPTCSCSLAPTTRLQLYLKLGHLQKGRVMCRLYLSLGPQASKAQAMIRMGGHQLPPKALFRHLGSGASVDACFCEFGMPFAFFLFWRNINSDKSSGHSLNFIYPIDFNWSHSSAG